VKKPFKRIVHFLLLVSISNTGNAQVLDSTQLAHAHVFRSIEEALIKPDSVYVLQIRRQRLTQFPEEIFTFRNLNKLDLSRNKIELIPRDIGTLSNLTELNLAKNKLGALPPDIGKLKNLRRLIIFQNSIAFIPAEIGEVERLEFLDLWGNELETLPNEISNLKTLSVMDLRVIEISDSKQKELHDLLPNTTILFSNSCDCGE